MRSEFESCCRRAARGNVCLKTGNTVTKLTARELDRFKTRPVMIAFCCGDAQGPANEERRANTSEGEVYRNVAKDGIPPDLLSCRDEGYLYI